VSLVAAKRNAQELTAQIIESPFLISTNAMQDVRFGAPEGPTRCGLNRRLMFVQPLSANLRTRRGFCCPIATGRQWMEGQWVDRRMAREWLMMVRKPPQLPFLEVIFPDNRGQVPWSL